MNEEKLKYLLEQFYSGMSTPEMEDDLLRFFSSDSSIGDEYKADKAMFIAMNSTAKVPDNLQQRITDSTIGKHKIHLNRLILRLSGIAATAAAIIALIFIPQHEPTTELTYREITNPAEARAILCMIDRELQSAMLPARECLLKLEETSIEIETTINEIISL